MQVFYILVQFIIILNNSMILECDDSGGYPPPEIKRGRVSSNPANIFSQNLRNVLRNNIKENPHFRT